MRDQVICGGCWFFRTIYCSVTYRDFNSSNVLDNDDNLGFRLIKTIKS